MASHVLVRPEVVAHPRPAAVGAVRTTASTTANSLIELSSGVDALYLSGRAALPVDLLEYLEEERELARSGNTPRIVDLARAQLLLRPHGFGRYRYCLRHEHAQIGLTPSQHLPAIRVQLRAEYLHPVGPAVATEWCHELLEPAVGPIRFTVARLDLYADFQGWELTGDDRHRFLLRGRERDTYEDGQDLTGFVFGRRTTNTVLARIYDKQRDVARTGADYWHSVWGARYDPNRPVHRVEFELGRTGLREYGVQTPADAVEAAGALWASLTETWLTYRSPTDDATRSRWPVAAEWRSVQRASIRGGAASIERVREGRREGSLRRLMPRLVGELVSFAVIVGTEQLSATLLELVPAIHELEQTRGVRFHEKVAARRREEAHS